MYGMPYWLRLPKQGKSIFGHARNGITLLSEFINSSRSKTDLLNVDPCTCKAILETIPFSLSSSYVEMVLGFPVWAASSAICTSP